MKTPAYVYDLDVLRERIAAVRQVLPGIPLTYSVKANSFITEAAAAQTSHVEVCSPGELEICKAVGIDPGKIIYSGVMKEEADIREAIAYGADILTAESRSHYDLIRAAAEEAGVRVKVLLRLSSDNQFGMDPEEIYRIVRERDAIPSVIVFGFHYYSGTQKKKADKIASDIERITAVTDRCAEAYGYKPELVEYGPGLATECFREDGDETDLELLQGTASLLLEFAKRVPLGIELGRFIAAGCGSYHTAVKDLKTNYGVQYAILDGGIHHLKYYGQIMALHTPVITQEPVREGEKQKYCLCGSLCTVADVLAREAELQELQVGDVLTFHKCGAYSLTEASALFLSRAMPEVYLKENGELRRVRESVESWKINMP